VALLLNFENEDAFDSDTEDPTLVLNESWMNEHTQDDMITLFVPENDGDESELHLYLKRALMLD